MALTLCERKASFNSGEYTQEAPALHGKECQVGVVAHGLHWPGP